MQVIANKRPRLVFWPEAPPVEPTIKTSGDREKGRGRGKGQRKGRRQAGAVGSGSGGVEPARASARVGFGGSEVITGESAFLLRVERHQAAVSNIVMLKPPGSFA